MQPVGNRGRSMNRLARQLPAAAREHTISQCQTNASRMMIGMGIPSSQSKIPRPIAVLLREMREGQHAGIALWFHNAGTATNQGTIDARAQISVCTDTLCAMLVEATTLDNSQGTINNAASA